MNEPTQPAPPSVDSTITESHHPTFPKSFTLQQMFWATTLVGFLIFLGIVCPIYGPYQIAATIGILVGWWLMASSPPPAIDQNDVTPDRTHKRGLVGAMLIWIGVVMSLYCLPACLVEATRTHDRFRDYDLYLEEQKKFPSNR